MMVKVVLARRVPKEKEAELRALLVRMRTLAMAQPGYVSGETLVSLDDPEQILVISCWYSLEAWHQWLDSNARKIAQKEVDELLGQGTNYQVFRHL